MSYRHRMAAALGLLWLLSCVCTVDKGAAQAPAEPVLALRVEPNLVPLEALRAQLEAELGVRIADGNRCGEEGCKYHQSGPTAVYTHRSVPLRQAGCACRCG